METVLTDFVSDLLHLCDRERLVFDDVLRRARRHYAAETGEDRTKR